MRITGIEAIPLACDMPYPLTYARGEYQTREAVLVRVATDDPDIEGWGEAAMWGGPAAVTVAVIEQEIAPLLAGEDPRRPEYLWEKVYQTTFYHGRQGILIAALSGVDIALWDILAKAAGLPLWRLLGGFGRPLAAYASAGYYRRGYPPEALAADVAAARARGFSGYKMKIGNVAGALHEGVLTHVPMRGTLADDLARVAAAREALGPGGRLMVDANTSLPTALALRYAEALAPFAPHWFEEPVEPENVAGCARLARASAIPIAGFETATGRAAFAQLIDAGALGVVQFDLVQVGGITEARKIAAFAQMRHLPVTTKNYSTAVSSAAAIHFLHALPNATDFEVDQDPNALATELAAGPVVRLEAGMAAPATDAPGLGIRIDPAALARFRLPG